MLFFFGRYYDFKRSAEKKEQKTIEAADKVGKQFHSTLRFKAWKNVSKQQTCSSIFVLQGYEICREKNT